MINDRLGVKIKDGYKLELQTPETFGSTKKINRQNQKCVRSERGEGGYPKVYENVQVDGGGDKAYVRYKKITNGVDDFSSHISMIKQVSNLLISCLASSTHPLAGFKSITCK